MVPIDWLDLAATNLQFIKNIISTKLNKTRYACVQQRLFVIHVFFKVLNFSIGDWSNTVWFILLTAYCLTINSEKIDFY